MDSYKQNAAFRTATNKPLLRNHLATVNHKTCHLIVICIWCAMWLSDHAGKKYHTSINIFCQQDNILIIHWHCFSWSTVTKLPYNCGLERFSNGILSILNSDYNHTTFLLKVIQMDLLVILHIQTHLNLQVMSLIAHFILLFTVALYTFYMPSCPVPDIWI